MIVFFILFFGFMIVISLICDCQSLSQRLLVFGIFFNANMSCEMRMRRVRLKLNYIERVRE